MQVSSRSQNKQIMRMERKQTISGAQVYHRLTQEFAGMGRIFIDDGATKRIENGFRYRVKVTKENTIQWWQIDITYEGTVKNKEQINP